METVSVRSPVFPIEWGQLAPLRLRARTVAEGVYAGPHRSVRKGAGVEFGGQRSYVPGDDLRFIDRRALLRHDKLMVREFETETDRALWLCVDATASMAYKSDKAPGAKYAYAALLAAALSRVALATGDPVGLGFVGGDGVRPQSASAGREAFDRVVGTLESARATGDANVDAGAVERAVAPIARKARRGSVIVFFSDLLDLPSVARGDLVPLGTGGRTLIVVQVLDPAEVDLPFEGSVRLRSLEGDVVVEADVDEVREAYKERLAELTRRWTRDVEAQGGRLVRAVTTDDATHITRSIVRAIAEAHA
ncbi:MAG: DUF58 domain-containing protein [Polyangiaceae bacterium]|nr:DUF58 domain-containing protein [Polyangiaceae bacterium]